MAGKLTQLDQDVIERATQVAVALTDKGVPGRWNRAEVLRVAASPGLAQLELALGMRAPEHGEKLDPYWARFQP